LCAKSEGKSKNTIDIVTNSIRYFEQFLLSEGLETDVTLITAREIRAFILYLQRKSCFSEHPYIRPRERGLSGHTVHCYLRSIRAFWSWLSEEEIIHDNPFRRVKLPRMTKKVTPTFSPSHLHQLLSAIDTSTAEGFRDHAVILTLFLISILRPEPAVVKIPSLTWRLHNMDNCAIWRSVMIRSRAHIPPLICHHNWTSLQGTGHLTE
jgi:integrase/recombinase XerD